MPAAAIWLNAVIGSGNARAVNAVVKPQWRRGESNIGGELDLAAMNKPIKAGGIGAGFAGVKYIGNGWRICGTNISNVIHTLVLRAHPFPPAKQFNRVGDEVAALHHRAVTINTGDIVGGGCRNVICGVHDKVAEQIRAAKVPGRVRAPGKKLRVGISVQWNIVGALNCGTCALAAALHVQPCVEHQAFTFARKTAQIVEVIPVTICQPTRMRGNSPLGKSGAVV